MSNWWTRGTQRTPREGIYSPGGRRSFQDIAYGIYQGRRRRFGARRPRRGGYWRNRGAGAKATRALMLINKFKKQEERKIIVDDQNTMQIPIGGNWIQQGFGPYCVQGNAVGQRLGNKTTVESLAMRWNIQLTALEELGTLVRLVILYDRRPAGADLANANVFQHGNEINSSYTADEEFKGRFQILMDKTISFDSVEGQLSGKGFFKKALKITYNANNGTVVDIQKGNFLIYAMAQGNAAAIDVNYGFKFTFTDA